MDVLDRLTPAQRRLMRLLAGPLLAVAVLCTEVRMGQFHTWSHFARFMVLLTPALLLYALVLELVEFDPNPADEPEETGAWRVAYLVSALLLAPVALYEFLESTGADQPASGFNLSFIFGASCLAAAVAAARRRVAYAPLLASVFFVAAWISFWADALSHPQFEDFRWLALVAAGVLAFVARRLAEEGAAEVDDVVTGAGIAGVIAGAIGSAPQVIASPLSVFSPGAGGNNGGEADGWLLFLLCLALFLAWYGAWRAHRGPVYVAAVGLVAFALSAGVHAGIEGAYFNRSIDAPAYAGVFSTHASLLGWPLLLTVAAIVAFAGGWIARPSDRA